MNMPEKYRDNGIPGSQEGWFCIPLSNRSTAMVVVSSGMDWEHVSVHIQTKTNLRKKSTARTPTWAEMCRIKEIFWNQEDTVVQYHPPKSEYVNNHPHVLHLWRPTKEDLPRPPAITVGIPGLEIK